MTKLYNEMVERNNSTTCKEKMLCMIQLFYMFKSKILNQEFVQGNEHSMSFILRTTFVDGSWIENAQTQVDGKICHLQNRIGYN